MRQVALTLSCFAVLSVMTATEASAEITWQENLRTAHAEAQKEHKLLLLHFYSDNCVWCDKLEKGSFQSPDVAEAIDQNFVAVKVHANKNPQLVKMFKVTAFPTDVIVTTQGKTVSHSVSPQAPNRYVAMLQSSLPKPAPGMMPPGTPNSHAPMVAQQQPPQQAAPQMGSPAPTSPSFQMPPQMPAASTGGATAQLASSRMESPSLDAPNPGLNVASKEAQSPSEKETTSTETATVEKTTEKSGEAELAMEGYCAVTVIKEDRWVEGKPEFGVIHLGKLYLFSNDEAMQAFLVDPVTYTPVLNEIDVVRFFEEGRIVPGKREWGLKDPTHNRMFFFADEAAMNHFWNEYERYTDAAINVMEKAVKDANPGTS
ncbi:Disulfide bond reductase DsbH precursor [Planctomycetes bacterium CA13]|uniref:Disulfide bond reductase DsbH n=1 Tax=Novipirellula herctigrandis TaxID=2527986 RepID=A0A5C5Z7V9_9BACT|nr:Disulfide bond reductase DsbH precursor [Planctomycetes bacterium CA13]